MIYIVVVLILLYFYFSKNIWKSKNVPHETPVPLFGNFFDQILRKKTWFDIVKEQYDKFNTERFFGLYQFITPIFVLRDPELIKQITIKDFDHFSEHSKFTPVGFDKIWEKNLLAMEEKSWRQMRPTLSPAFTSSKMRMMFDLMQNCSEKFTKYFLEQDSSLTKVELKDIFSKYTNDVIASTAFGLDCNTMKEQDNEFYRNGSKMTDFSGIQFFIYRFSPFLQRVFNLKIVPDTLGKFFSNVIYDTLKLRRDKNLVRKDMIHLLLQAQTGIEEKQDQIKNDDSFAATFEYAFNSNLDVPITDDVICSQAFIFFFAGFDTVSTQMAMTGYELMMNPDIQEKLLNEIDRVYKENEGKLTYDCILGMKYLDMVISESLRKWPPIPVIDRNCVREYNIRKENDNVLINKNCVLWIPVYAIHRDSQYYPNPDKFDPERFNDENKVKINPFTYMPFGVGPRNCIGSRFALLETKIIWVNLLKHFKIVSTESSPIKPEWDSSYFSYMPKNRFQMAFKRRN